MIRTHGVDHWRPEADADGPPCWGCKIQTVGIAPSAMPSRHPGAANNVKLERDLVKDLDAYKRMRLAGEHPKHTRGAARIESQAESSFEIQSGQLAHERAKGRDAAKSISRRGKEWRRRTVDAYAASQKDPMGLGAGVVK